MRAILYKDFISLKKVLILMLIALSFISYYFYRENQIYLLPLFFIFLPVIILGMLFASDSLDHVEKYLVASPIKRSTIVLSRYVIVWALSGFATLLTLLIPLLTRENPLHLPWYLMAPGMFLLTSIVYAIQLPLIYLFNENSARFIFAIIYFITFAFFSSIASNKEWLIVRLQSILQRNVLYISVGVALATILVNVISYLISKAIYQKKEL